LLQTLERPVGPAVGKKPAPAAVGSAADAPDRQRQAG
jgi:hypothetical protein